MPDTLPEQQRAGRIAAAFQRLRASDRRAFIPYVTAGYPRPADTLGVLALLAEEGADVIELGIPFSDPLADGPTIQAATWSALRQGVDIPGVLRWTAAFSAGSDVPIVLFSYLNPVLRYGPERFLADAEDAGAAGLLLTDLPVGEDGELEEILTSANLDLVRLVAPTTRRERMARIVEAARGFIYYISRTGVTGERAALREELANEVAGLREVTDLPIAVGFGISNFEQARLVAGVADGVVVGSALVRSLGEEGLDGARRLARTLREGVDAATP